jgi:signal transduction histidine kinase
LSIDEPREFKIQNNNSETESMKRQISLLDFIDKMEQINQFQDKIDISSTISRIWELFLDEIRNFIIIDICALFLVNEHSYEFVLTKSHPRNKKEICKREIENQIECDMFSWIINRRKPAVIHSFVYKDKKSVIMLPLSTVKRTIGVILLMTPISEHLITQENLRLLTMLTKQCALVMENWFLYHNLKKKHEALEKAKDQIIQTEKMASIGRLTAGASHEILNPLNIISGHIQLLSIKQKFNPDAEKSLNIVKLQTDRIKKIIDGLARFSKLPNPGKKMLNMNALVGRYISETKSAKNKKKILMSEDLDSQIPKIWGNEKLLLQVFSFLMSNAEDAVSEKGTVAISTRKETRYPGTELERSYIRIDFTDNGCGIAKENITKAFDPFFTTKRSESKTGLGLSLSYAIIQAHGGDIQVQSPGNKGTVVSIYLPV